MVERKLNDPLYILGSGGQARVTHSIAVAIGYSNIQLIDMDAEQDFLQSANFNTQCVIAIGDNRIRQKLAQTLKGISVFHPNLIHPSAIINDSVKIENGTQIMPGAIINTGAKIGAHCLINSGAIIEHNSEIGDYTHCAPSSVICGGCIIKEGVMLGASATVIQNIEIGSWSIIGAGSTVISNIRSSVTAFGTPAQERS